MYEAQKARVMRAKELILDFSPRQRRLLARELVEEEPHDSLALAQAINDAASGDLKSEKESDS